MSRTHYVPIKYSFKKQLKQLTMNTQLTIEETKIARNHKYKFTPHNHTEIIQALEKYRNEFNILPNEFSKMAGYWEGHYKAICDYRHAFSEPSYRKYRELIIELKTKGKAELKAVDEQPQSVQYNLTELTEEMCINFLKATGKYKISKSEVTTNWVEL